MPEKKEIKLEEIAVVGRFTDGKVRQVITTENQNDMILSLIKYYNNGRIRVSEEIIETIEILKREDK